AAIFKRKAVRVLEVDRLRPLVVDNLGDGDPLGPQFVALARQTGRRTGLEGEVIKAGRDPEPAVDAGVVGRRNVRHPAWLQKGDQLAIADVEKQVTQPAALFDGNRV